MLYSQETEFKFQHFQKNHSGNQRSDAVCRIRLPGGDGYFSVPKLPYGSAHRPVLRRHVPCFFFGLRHAVSDPGPGGCNSFRRRFPYGHRDPGDVGRHGTALRRIFQTVPAAGGTPARSAAAQDPAVFQKGAREKNPGKDSSGTRSGPDFVFQHQHAGGRGQGRGYRNPPKSRMNIRRRYELSARYPLHKKDNP